MQNQINEPDKNVVNTINKLTIEALQSREFLPYEQEANSRLRKVAEVLSVCSKLNDPSLPRREPNLPGQEGVCKVCQLADAVSNIADALLGNGLDEVLDTIKEELRLRQAHHSHEPAAESSTESAKPLMPIANELEISPLYAHYEQRPSDPRRWTMDRKTLAQQIPDFAAQLFAFGVVSVAVSLVAALLTESIVPRFILVFGLIFTAVGQKMGERALSDGER